jgi:aldose 1-epimerase
LPTLSQHTLQNKQQLKMTVLNYGATIQKITTAQGSNLVLGYDEPEQYVRSNPYYYGAIIGPLANRVAKAEFTLDNKTYRLEANEGAHCLHSGSGGLHQVYWQVREIPAENKLQLTYTSAKGEAGFLGGVEFKITYQLTDANEIIMSYSAQCDIAQPIDLTNHTYWNLAGGGSVLDYQVQSKAKHYLPVDHEMIPTGEIKALEGTALDFTQAKTFAADIQVLSTTKGYDHYFVCDTQDEQLKFMASIYSPASKTQLIVSSTAPGFQCYTGNFLPKAHEGFCIETQGMPNSVNHSALKNCVHRHYQATTVYQLVM